MPLKAGKSRKIINENMKEGIKSFKKKGTFGTSKPKSMKKAISQIYAATMKKAGKSRKK